MVIATAHRGVFGDEPELKNLPANRLRAESGGPAGEFFWRR
jgi:hypothetical protein